MDYEDYAPLEGVTWSHLRRMRLSPLHYHAAVTDTAPQKVTDAMLRGTALDWFLTQPDRWATDIAVWGATNKTGKLARRYGKDWDDFCGENAGKLILRPEDRDLAKAMGEAVLRHPDCRRVLMDPALICQPAVQWVNPYHGIACKGLLDAVIPSGENVGGYSIKSTQTSIAPRPWGAFAYRHGYLHQEAHYRAGWFASRGVVLPWYMLVVEQNPPHDVALYRIPDDALTAAATEVGEWIGKVAWCTERDEWPGVAPGLQELELPEHAFADVMGVWDD